MSALPAAQFASRYGDWKAPLGDGEILISPSPTELIANVVANHNKLSQQVEPKLLGTPLSALRASAREWIGHRDQSQLLVATGHQTELWHPGVWIKNAVIHAIAAATGGRAFHFAVDTDSPKHLSLRWPGTSIALSDDPRAATAAWSGLLDAPTPRHIQSIRQLLAAASETWGLQPEAFGLLDSLTRLAIEQPRMSNALCNALHELDWSLGLRYDALVCSPIFESPTYLQFLAYIVSRARQFAGDYNDALHAYRDEHGMTTNSRPMPDLFASHEAIELPFWLDDLTTGTRSRPSVFEVGEKTVLKLVSGAEIDFSATDNGPDAAVRLRHFLAITSHRIAPRALTLTMFLRLFMADMFVHGIGGGRYDQVLDKLIHAHFGIEPPHFAVATATMLFPTAVGRTRACSPCVAREGHQLRHETLGPSKQRYLDLIAAAPRRSRQRSDVFLQMQTAMRNNWPADPKISDWEQRLAEVRAQEQRDAIEFDRELFYAVQPRQRLVDMIERVAALFTSAR